MKISIIVDSRGPWRAFATVKLAQDALKLAQETCGMEGRVEELELESRGPEPPWGD